MPPEPAPDSGGKRPDRKHRFILAERTQESGGNYLVVNPNSGALGAWQVMPSNLPGWLSESGLPQMSAYDYLHSVHAQNRLAWVVLGGAYDKYGARGAAAWWYSGQTDWHATYGNPPVYQYVDDVLALMGAGNFPANTSSMPQGPGAYTLPPPNEADWSAQVRAAAVSHHNAAVNLSQFAAALNKIR